MIWSLRKGKFARTGVLGGYNWLLFALGQPQDAGQEPTRMPSLAQWFALLPTIMRNGFDSILSPLWG